MCTLEQGLATAEHAVFVRRLAAFREGESSQARDNDIAAELRHSGARGRVTVLPKKQRF